MHWSMGEIGLSELMCKSRGDSRVHNAIEEKHKAVEENHVLSAQNKQQIAQIHQQSMELKHAQDAITRVRAEKERIAKENGIKLHEFESSRKPLVAAGRSRHQLRPGGSSTLALLILCGGR